MRWWEFFFLATLEDIGLWKIGKNVIQFDGNYYDNVRRKRIGKWLAFERAAKSADVDNASAIKFSCAYKGRSTVWFCKKGGLNIHAIATINGKRAERETKDGFKECVAERHFWWEGRQKKLKKIK